MTCCNTGCREKSLCARAPVSRSTRPAFGPSPARRRVVVPKSSSSQRGCPSRRSQRGPRPCVFLERVRGSSAPSSHVHGDGMIHAPLSDRDSARFARERLASTQNGRQRLVGPRLRGGAIPAFTARHVTLGECGRRAQRHGRASGGRGGPAMSSLRSAPPRARRTRRRSRSLALHASHNHVGPFSAASSAPQRRLCVLHLCCTLPRVPSRSRIAARSRHTSTRASHVLPRSPPHLSCAPGHPKLLPSHRS